MTDDLSWLPTESTSLTDAAIAYASHGFRVLPVWGMKKNGQCACGKSTCTAPGKHPMGKAWQKAATSDVDAVRDARKSAGANVGLAMGGDERLVAVDIDGEKGLASWAELEANVRPAPPTLTQRTGRADVGYQRIYRVPKRLDIKRLGNRASFRLPGIDTRIDNGQIVVAPSLHASGRRYEWTTREPIAEMPEWLFEALAAPLPTTRPTPAPSPPPSARTGLDPYLAKVLSHAENDIATCTEGGRNQLLFAKSCTVFEYFLGEGIDHLDAWRALEAAGRSCGLPAGEVSSVLSKAWRKAQSSPVRKVPPPTVQARPAPALVPVTSTEAYPATWEEASPASTEDADDRAWEETMHRTVEGAVKNTFGNVLKMLRHAKVFAGRWSYDQMRITPCLDGEPLKDSDVAKVREIIEDTWGVAPSKDTTTDAIMGIAAEQSFHPVQRYLRSLTWDGQKRIERIEPEIFGGNGDALSQRMMRCWFVSAVARALNPGCKVDTSLVLYGDQGHRKSTFFSVLGGEWYSDSYVDVRSKDGVLQVHAGWIYEWAEIERITTKREASDVKAFITIARDNVRPPYGRGVVNQPRSGVIVGTTNSSFLDDETGSRRFHPITIRRRLDDANIATLRAWRDQLWAEAVAAYDAREEWWLSEEDERARTLIAAEHTIEDAWTERIAAYLAAPHRAGREVTTVEILRDVISIPLDRIGRGEEIRAGKALRTLGWSPRQCRRNGAVVRVYQSASDLVTLVTDESSVKSSVSLTSQLSQLVLRNPTEIIEGSSSLITTSIDCDCDTQSSVENDSVQVSQSAQPSQVILPIGPAGYPSAWDEEGT